MRCDEAQGDLSAYLDGTLPIDQQQAVENHLASCPQCRAQIEDYRRIGRVLREELVERSPAGLQERIRAAIAQEVDEKDRSARRWGGRLAAQAAALLLVAGLSGAGGWIAATTSSQTAGLAHDVATAHVRSLLQDNLTHVASSDRHQVKPWFAGRLDFSPPVPDLSAQGFALRGGRLDYVGDQRVAALIYMRRQHVITLFVWPSEQASPPQSSRLSEKGYNAIRWTQHGMHYWAISDLNMKELGDFQALFEAA